MGTLLISQGVPMILAGDEVLRTQGGNNNAWCQDNEISWLDWSLARMAKNGLSSLPVTSSDGRFLGLLTREDAEAAL